MFTLDDDACFFSTLLFFLYTAIPAPASFVCRRLLLATEKQARCLLLLLLLLLLSATFSGPSGRCCHGMVFTPLFSGVLEHSKLFFYCYRISALMLAPDVLEAVW